MFTAWKLLVRVQYGPPARLCAAVLVLAACGGDQGPAAPPEPFTDGTGASLDEPLLATAAVPRSERLARQARDLAAALERMRASGLDDRVLASIEHLLERPDEWFTLDAWGIARLSLRCHLEWHTPAPGREKIRALDLERRKSPIHAIREHARRLAEHGIGLLVVPVPTRLEVYPDRLPDVPAQGQDFSGQATGTTAFLALLVAEGIEVVDLLPRLVGERDDPDDRLYFDQNNHWTPRGAAVAARAVAQQLADMEGWTPGPARERIDFVRKRERGDEALYAKHEPPPETVIYRSVLTPDGQPAHERDRQSPLLLLGDSCTMQFKDHGSDLASLLYAETGWRVDTITFSSGASRVWHALARRHDGLSGKRWVVWIFNSRALALKEFKTYDLFPE